ncbi:hypothetical protein BDV96DRAFT_583409 [Lophiotrema nucula]|uniref:Secreted protein n=1 Tax=Lophiotrema nucula TaxID=690887 RepID=A0A6A5YTX8_9PLEO|nr:hypothetical protein BDV96DRAFT_583409 [Lophiotrema nucula]
MLFNGRSSSSWADLSVMLSFASEWLFVRLVCCVVPNTCDVCHCQLVRPDFHSDHSHCRFLSGMCHAYLIPKLG